MTSPDHLGVGPEFDRIRRLLTDAPAGPASVLVGPGDDAAVLDGGWVLSTDLSVEDVHFRRAWLSPSEIGYRAVMAAVSDIAAMGADVVGILTSLAVPDGESGLLDGLGRGIREACEELGAGLMGGDLTRSVGALALDVVAVGRSDDPVLRSGARAGDELWVTGSLGGAGAAVALLDGGQGLSDALAEAFARPRARLREIAWIRERARPTALIDLSDGLGGDAGHVATASGVAVVLDWPSLPVSAAAEAALGDRAARRLALQGGEDYELCFTLEKGVGDTIAPEFRVKFGLPLTRVGWVEEGAGVRVRDPDGTEHPAQGFDHFRGGE